MNLENLLTKKNIIVFIGILIIVVLVIFNLNFYSKIKISQQEISDQKLILDQKNKNFANLEQIKKEYAKLLEDKEQFQILSYEKQNQVILKEMESIVKSSGLILKNIEFRQKNNAMPIFKETSYVSSLGQFNFTLQLVGAYTSLKNFISIIEKSYPLIKISRLNFSKTSATETTNFQLELKTYYR